jgi:hypothetical protein
MSIRRIPVFFYGLFMDAEILRTKGIAPTGIQRASVLGFALRIGQRATLIADAESTAYGLLMNLTHDEIERLYSEASVSAYRPEAVLARLEDDSRVAALCFNLVEPPAGGETNPDYAARLRGLALRLKLPGDYIQLIR